MTTIDIHLATSSDLDILALMFDQYRQFYEQKSDPSLATIFMSDRIAKQESIIFIAKDSAGFGLGFCQLYPSFCSVEAAPIYVLYDLFVRPEYRRNGVARELLLEAEAHATLNQIGRMDLTTAKSNTQAQALYESLGWIRDEVFLTYNRRPNS